MNKKELIDEVRKILGKDTTKAQAERATNAVIDAFKRAIKKDGNLQLIGFGTFTVAKRAARTGVNPQTGQKMKIKASKTVKFRPGTALKAAVA